jgi:hypothetical protein
MQCMGDKRTSHLPASKDCPSRQQVNQSESTCSTSLPPTSSPSLCLPSFLVFSCATFFLYIRKLCDAPFRTFTRIRWTLFIVCCGMLIVGGISIGQQLRHNLNSFVYYKGGKQAAEELNDPRDPTNYIHVSPFLAVSLVYSTNLE